MKVNHKYYHPGKKTNTKTPVNVFKTYVFFMVIYDFCIKQRLGRKLSSKKEDWKKKLKEGTAFGSVGR